MELFLIYICILLCYHLNEYQKHGAGNKYNKILLFSGQVIYPGKLSNANCFRIANIGDLYPSDMRHLMKCIGKVLDAMGVPVPVPVPAPISVRAMMSSST
jgi:aspartate aminotransferase-like enzyme